MNKTILCVICLILITGCNKGNLRSDFSGADLSKKNYSFLNLGYSVFVRANLVSTRFVDSRLKRTNFSSSNLHKADLSGANLGHSIFVNTNMSNSNLSHSDLFFSNFSNANFENAKLINAILVGTNLNNANLKNADLTGVIGLTCKQLASARNWEAAIRDDSLKCN